MDNRDQLIPENVTSNSDAGEASEIRRNSFKLPEYLQGTSFADWVAECERSENGDSKQELYVPTAWSNEDNNGMLELTNFNMRVTYIGPGRSDSHIRAIRANYHIHPQCGVYYFEIEIISKGRDGQIGIGFCANNVMLSRLPGWEPNSWGYHGDDGHSFNCTGTGKPYGPTFGMGDVIGCGINFRDNTAFFTKNGDNLGVAFKDIRGTLYPCVGLRTLGEKIEVNFGQKRFKFDIEDYMKSA